MGFIETRLPRFIFFFTFSHSSWEVNANGLKGHCYISPSHQESQTEEITWGKQIAWKKKNKETKTKLQEDKKIKNK